MSMDKNCKWPTPLRFLLITAIMLFMVPALAAGDQVIYENNFESDAAAVDVGGNKALGFIVAGDVNNSWVGVFQQDLYFDYAEVLNSGAILSFDLILPDTATYTGLLKAQAVTKMGDSWTWTQSNTIADIAIGDFTSQGNGYKTASVSIAFGAEIEAVLGIKAIVPCLAASNCDYNGVIYLDNVILVNGTTGTPEPVLTTIYENNFESDASAVDISGNRALGFIVTGDANNSWVGVFQQDLYFDYADALNNGATLSFDLILPDTATYTGLLKAQAVTKMGDSWTWTQSNTIADIAIGDFTSQGNGHKTASVSIAFGAEIEAVLGIKAIVPCLAASNCDYVGPIYLDNVKLANLSEPGEEPELPPVDPIILSFDNPDDIYSWSDGGSWDYSGGLTIGYDSPLQAMQLDVDYTGSSSSTWSEAKAKYTFPTPRELNGYNQFSFDFIYDPSKMTQGSFYAKLSAGIIDANTTVKNAADFGNGLKKAVAVITFVSAENLVNDFTLGLAGNTTDYKGAFYIDNVMFSQVADGYVKATLTAETQIPVHTYSDSIVANGQTQPITGSMKLVDDQASDYTVKLAAYLDAIGKTDSVLFGHQNDITAKAGNRTLSNSDTKDVTGSLAAVMGIDMLSLTGNELPAAVWNDPLEKRVAAAAAVAREASGEGAIITLSAHMPNFAIIDRRVQNSLAGTADPSDSNSAGILSDGHYNFSGYTPGTVTGDIVRRIMPGQDLNYLFTDYLDMIAAYAKALENDNIAVMFRPFHEGTGSWFWWGRAFCDQEAFKNLYKYTVEYLRDIKDVHNFLYVYGPGGEAENTEQYGERYPGDDYVDMVGFDMYHSNPAVGDNFIDQFKNELAIVQQFAAEHNKLFAVTETGIANGSQAVLKTGNARKDWFNEILDAVAPSTASYFLVWANFGESSGFYIPYVVKQTATYTKGHEMIDNFIDFYNDPRSVFADQVGDYTLLDTAAMENTNATAYILSPVSGDRVLEAAVITASVTNIPDTAAVRFTATNKAGTVSQEIPAARSSDTRYTGTLTAEQLALFGEVTGTLSLVIDGTVYNTINLKYNMPEPVIDPTVVDTFENYGGDSELLNIAWSTGFGTGCTITPALSTNSYSGGYGLEFRYFMNAGGYAGMTKSMDNADWSGKNAVQLWTVPDNKHQKVVVQVTSGRNVFEVYLQEYDEYVDAEYPLLVTIPFSSFTGRDNANAVFDAGNIQSFGLWCNTIVPEGEDADTYTITSVLYYDEIKAITSGATSVEFEELIPNRSPVLDAIGSKTVNEGTPLEFTVSASDPDGDVLVFSADTLPAGAAFDATRGAFSWTPDYGEAGKYRVTFTVSDGVLSGSEEIVIRVNNVTAVQYIQQMIDTLKAMKLKKPFGKLLANELKIVRMQLCRNRPAAALTGLAVFVMHVKLVEYWCLSREKADTLLDAAAQLHAIIIRDYAGKKIKGKGHCRR